MHCHFRTALIDLWKGQLFYQPDFSTLSQPNSYKRVDFFELKACLPLNRNRDQLNIPFWLASKAFRLEIHRIMLSRFTFNFDCPKACTHFSRQSNKFMVIGSNIVAPPCIRGLWVL